VKPVRIGISSCLLGEEVRFDGGHKRNPFLADTLGPHVEWVRVCPEVELGLGVPRETLRLVRVGGDVRMITTRTNVDHTDAMRAWARRRADALASMDLRGYVLKKDSPSCGMEHVKVYGREGAVSRTGIGLFAEALKTRFPTLPIEEEGRLGDPALRESFIERVFAYQRLRDFFETRWTHRTLTEFHAKHELSLLAHSTKAFEQLGRFVSRGRHLPRPQLEREYEARFMAALANPATRKRHMTVLRHIARHLKKNLDPASRSGLLSCIEEYRSGLVPLVVPLRLLRHHVFACRIDALMGQVYLEAQRVPGV